MLWKPSTKLDRAAGLPTAKSLRINNYQLEPEAVLVRYVSCAFRRPSVFVCVYVAVSDKTAIAKPAPVDKTSRSAGPRSARKLFASGSVVSASVPSGSGSVPGAGVGHLPQHQAAVPTTPLRKRKRTEEQYKDPAAEHAAVPVTTRTVKRRR